MKPFIGTELQYFMIQREALELGLDFNGKKITTGQALWHAKAVTSVRRPKMKRDA